jgi:hypothetical protein
MTTTHMLTQQFTQTVGGESIEIGPTNSLGQGDPQDAWNARIDRLLRVRLQRAPEDGMDLRTGLDGGVWWISFSDRFTMWSIADGEHLTFTTATRLEFRDVPDVD